jgi:predicted nucleic acid-binding protein
VVTLILVDSNVWIFLNIENYPEHFLAENKIAEVRKQGIITNAIVVSEVFHKISLILGKRDAFVRIKKMLDSSDVSYIPVEGPIMRQAIELAATKPIRINDAVIAQQTLQLKASILTDNVKDFKKVKGLKVIPLE